MSDKLFKDEHLANMPTIRIAKIGLKNFKSVKSGEITFNCGRKFIPYGTESDITGIYGQNGSGKTSMIYAIGLLKYLLSGESIPDAFAECISIDSDCAVIVYTLDIQYPNRDSYESNNDIRKVVYTVTFGRELREKKQEINLFADKEFNDYFVPKIKFRPVVIDESIKISGTVKGRKTPLKPYIDTSGELVDICPKTKLNLLVGSLDEDKRVALGINKNKAYSEAKSFVFLSDMMSLYYKNSDYSYLYQMLFELQHWGKFNLFFIDSNSYSFSTLNAIFFLYLDGNPVPIPASNSFELPTEDLKECAKVVNSIGGVVQEVIPGLQVKLKDYGITSNVNGKDMHSAELIVVRDGNEMPFRYESDGIKKLISTLYFIIELYTDDSVTVAYDEFDSGVFEYLLGEILQILRSSGKGQLIFTSHNLYPLTVLGNECIYFTTTDPYDRFIKLTGIGGTNNLRTVYLREIGHPDRYDNLYNETKRNRIISAMRKADSDLWEDQEEK